jgi:hypothetical protein
LLFSNTSPLDVTENALKAAEALSYDTESMNDLVKVSEIGNT